MDDFTLNKANEINREIKDLNSVADYFKRHKEDKNDIKMLTEFFNDCRNLGSGKIKEELASVAFDQVSIYLQNKIEHLVDEYEKL